MKVPRCGELGCEENAVMAPRQIDWDLRCPLLFAKGVTHEMVGVRKQEEGW